MAVELRHAVSPQVGEVSLGQPADPFADIFNDWLKPQPGETPNVISEAFNDSVVIKFPGKKSPKRPGPKKRLEVLPRTAKRRTAMPTEEFGEFTDLDFEEITDWHGSRPTEEDELAETDSLTMYIREIRSRPLLTPAEEISLAQTIESGSPEESQAAKNRFAEGNLRLVISVAKKYIGRGMPLSDLVQEGNVGLLRGVERFDWRRGYKFSTYGTWWIRQAMGRALAKRGRTIRVPIVLGQNIGKANRAEQRFVIERGRPPTREEMINLLSSEGLSSKDIENVFEFKASGAGFVDSLDEAPESFDDPEDYEPRAHNFWQEQLDPSEEVEQQTLSDEVEGVLGKLSPKHELALRLSAGFTDSGKSYSTRDFARSFSISEYRAEKLVNEAKLALSWGAGRDFIRSRQ